MLRSIYISIISFCLVLGLGFSLTANGQGNSEAHIRTGDKHYEQMSYALARVEYQKAADRGAINEHVTKRLAETSMLLGDTKKAEHWYSIVVKFMNREDRDLFNYAEALKSNEKYEEAEEWMDKYYAIARKDKKRSNISDHAYKLKLDKDRYRIQNLDMNTEGSEFGPTYIGEDVMFCSNRGKNVGIKRIAAYDGSSFMGLYLADIGSSDKLVNVRLLPGKVNSKYHDGPASVSTDGSRMYFTRNNFFKGKTNKSQTGVNRLNIYSANSKDGQWTDLAEFNYNNNECSVAHPALSADGKRLFFVSDMPGGYGGSDIYMCKWIGGDWGEPVNLGLGINTVENETFPFIHEDGTLYFASNGHPGLGGLDMFAAKRNNSGKYDLAINMGFPLNSSKDDFGLMIDMDHKKGYISSNRPGGKGSDDIYQFEMLYPLAPRYIVTGVVLEERSGAPLSDIQIILYKDEVDEVNGAVTTRDGKYSFTIEKGSNYKIGAMLDGYVDEEKYLTTIDLEVNQIIVRDMLMALDEGITLKGVARYKNKNEFVENLKISLIDLVDYSLKVVITDEGGDLRFRLDEDTDYELLFEKADHFARSFSVNTAGMSAPSIVNLNELMDMRFENIEIGEPIAIEGITWSYNSTKLDAGAKRSLGELVDMLRNNPTVRVEIACHTDSRGDDAANLQLTQTRAEAVMRYFSSRSILSSRIEPKGYGETELKNHCTNGVQCTEEEQKVNRRTEFIVLEY